MMKSKGAGGKQAFLDARTRFPLTRRACARHPLPRWGKGRNIRIQATGVQRNTGRDLIAQHSDAAVQRHGVMTQFRKATATPAMNPARAAAARQTQIPRRIAVAQPPRAGSGRRAVLGGRNIGEVSPTDAGHDPGSVELGVAVATGVEIRSTT